METVAQGAVYSDLTDPIYDANGSPVVGGEASITVTLFDSANANQSTGITVAHVSAGRYRISKTLSGSAVVGSWGGTVVYDDGAGLVRTQTITFTVLTAAQADPAGALAALAVGGSTGTWGAALAILAEFAERPRLLR